MPSHGLASVAISAIGQHAFQAHLKGLHTSRQNVTASHSRQSQREEARKHTLLAYKQNKAEIELRFGGKPYSPCSQDTDPHINKTKGETRGQFLMSLLLLNARRGRSEAISSHINTQHTHTKAKESHQSTSRSSVGDIYTPYVQHYSPRQVKSRRGPSTIVLSSENESSSQLFIGIGGCQNPLIVGCIWKMSYYNEEVHGWKDARCTFPQAVTLVIVLSQRQH